MFEKGEPTKLSKRDLKNFDETERNQLLNQTHAFVIIPRDDGKYFYVDPTYSQFTGGQPECVIDIVDAKKLKNKYKIILWSPNAQKTINKQQIIKPEENELSTFPHIQRAETILKKMEKIER